MKKFISILLSTLMICSCFFSVGAVEESQSVPEKEVLRKHLCEIGELADHMTDEEYFFKNFGTVGEYALCFGASNLTYEIDYETQIGNYRFSDTNQQTTDPLGLYLIKGETIYTFNAEIYEEKLISDAEVEAVVEIIKANIEDSIFTGLAVEKVNLTPEEVFEEKTGNKNYSLINLGVVGDYGLYYNDTENVTFMEYDKIIGGYKFGVFSQQTPYDIGLYLISATDLYTLEEAVESNIVTDMDAVYDMIKAKDVKYTFTAEKVESNNGFQQAQSVEANEVIHGRIYDEDIVDFYKITLTKRQRVTMYTLGTHYQNFHPGYEYGWVGESLAFDIYHEKPNSFNIRYSKVDKNSCYYYYDIVKDEDFEVEYDGFVVDNEKWEQTEDMVLNAGTYYFVFKFDSFGKSQNYKFMYKLGDPVPAIYNKNHSNEFNLKYKSVSAGDYLHLRVRDGEVEKWTSENTKIAKVNKNGKVTALQKGTTNIVATLSNGEKLKCTVTVTSDPVLKINSKNAKSITLNKGQKITVTIKGKAIDIQNKYTDTKIAKITGKKTANKFTVQALAKGKTTLKVKVNGVKTLKLKVTVK